MTKRERKILKKLGSLVVGSGLLLAGITLVLTQWNFVVAFFKGMMGIILAIAGLLVLMLIKE